MNLQNQVVKNICGFYVSESHLATMLLPYLSKNIENGVKITTILEEGIEENIKEVLKNININSKLKEKILAINWEKTKMEKYIELEKNINNYVKENNEIEMLINGTNEKIDNINSMINIWVEKNKNKIKNKNIKIINLYKISEFNNINKILDKNDAIINTSGIHKIEDVFIGYKLKVANK